MSIYAVDESKDFGSKIAVDESKRGLLQDL